MVIIAFLFSPCDAEAIAQQVHILSSSLVGCIARQPQIREFCDGVGRQVQQDSLPAV